MPLWNDAYNKTPRQGYNPGYGAREFQNLKGRITDRMSIDHVFGENETLATGIYGENLSGVHKEGSARILVTDGNQAGENRARSRQDNLTQIGRTNLVFVDRGIDYLEQNEVADTSTTLGTNNVQLNVVAELDSGVADVVTIFDYDKLVNTTYDQDIAGIKNFTRKARVPDFDALNPYKTDEATDIVWTGLTEEQQNVMPAKQLIDRIVDAKEHNILDATDAYNKTEPTDGVEYTLHSIAVQEVRAIKVYGTVWG